MAAKHFLETPPQKQLALRVEFHWHVDRFLHIVGVTNGEHFEPLLASVEGSTVDAWPANPVCQDLSMMESTALFVGMAGTSHFSASIETTASAIRFDMACRLKEAPKHLGSKYRILDPVNMIDAECLSFFFGDRHSGRLRLRSHNHDRVATISTPTGITLCVNNLPASYPATVRWNYQFELDDLLVANDNKRFLSNQTTP